MSLKHFVLLTFSVFLFLFPNTIDIINLGNRIEGGSNIYPAAVAIRGKISVNTGD